MIRSDFTLTWHRISKFSVLIHTMQINQKILYTIILSSSSSQKVLGVNNGTNRTNNSSFLHVTTKMRTEQILTAATASLLNILCKTTHHTYSTTERHAGPQERQHTKCFTDNPKEQNTATFKFDSTHRLSPQNLTNKQQQQLQGMAACQLIPIILPCA